MEAAASSPASNWRGRTAAELTTFAGLLGLRFSDMNLKSGLIAGLSWGLGGLLGLPAVIAAFTLIYWWFCDTPNFDRKYDIGWWQLHAFPGLVVIPMLLFFAGFTSHASERATGFARTLGILAVTSLPMAVLLGAMGMAHFREKSAEHPPMYFSEVLMFLIPIAAVSFILLRLRGRRICVPELDDSPEIQNPTSGGGE